MEVTSRESSSLLPGEDDGISGEEIDKRPGFKQLLAQLDRGGIPGLVRFSSR